MASSTEIKIGSNALHAVPLTIEGSSVLHQMFRFRWTEWRKLSHAQQHEIAAEASTVLQKMENDAAGQSALFSLLGHKGDLLVVHFRNSFVEEIDLVVDARHRIVPRGPRIDAAQIHHFAWRRDVVTDDLKPIGERSCVHARQILIDSPRRTIAGSQRRPRKCA